MKSLANPRVSNIQIHSSDRHFYQGGRYHFKIQTMNSDDKL